MRSHEAFDLHGGRRPMELDMPTVAASSYTKTLATHGRG